MFTLSSRQQWLTGSLLLLAITLTRSHHLASIHHLPEASWAVFFLAGFYLRSWRVLIFYMGVAVLVDYLSITFAGVSDFCITPAYGLLIPAYTALWYAGRRYARYHTESFKTLLPLGLAVLTGALAAEIFSSAGFYVFSNYFTELSLNGYLERFQQYFPAYLQAIVMYLIFAACLHILFISKQPALLTTAE